jgi:hypothetical protein
MQTKISLSSVRSQFLSLIVTHGKGVVSCDRLCGEDVYAENAGEQNLFLEFVNGVVG